MSKIITLLTDFGDKDCYVGVMKGVIKKIFPSVSIIDITHHINPGDIEEAAFVAKSSYKYFPSGSIHLMVVDPGVGSERRAIIVKCEDYYFIAPDNGILSYLINDLKEVKIVSITNRRYFLDEISCTFHGRDIFAPTAAYLAKGIKIEEFGEIIQDICLLPQKIPLKDKDILKGEIIYIDRFGNLITNITLKDLEFLKDFIIEIKGKRISNINRFYSQSKVGELLAIWGSYGFLEISVNRGSAKDFLEVERGEEIIIKRKV